MQLLTCIVSIARPDQMKVCALVDDSGGPTRSITALVQNITHNACSFKRWRHCASRPVRMASAQLHA